ncbi:unnamed protein product [Caenorhabditis bovis]|uniref:Uncharacterized protein n=1 Tax=Caenorhabditis bovis TaxID=2654633 RepID=A0A8S1EMM9_9PELO|nr:unnamed protein product [Caenorhabditis bovis]
MPWLDRPSTHRIVWIAAYALIIVLLLIATGVVNMCLTPRLAGICDFHDNNDTIGALHTKCDPQRRATLLFITYCLVRLISNKFEAHLGSRLMKQCGVRNAFPGSHFGAALGFPYLTRSLSASIQLTSSSLLFIVIIFASTSIAFYPYVKDFAKLCKLIYNAIQRRHYTQSYSLIFALISLYLYFTVIFIEILDVSFGAYCPQSIFGLPILFPNVNFPLVLYIFHMTILSQHKVMPAIIYEVNNDDCFIQLNRMRCITNKDCPERTTTIQRRALEGRIVQVRSIRDLDDIVPCKISTIVRKTSLAVMSMK